LPVLQENAKIIGGGLVMEETKFRFINPFTDFGFKKIFGQEYNKDLLIDFLNSILSLKSPIVDVTYGSQEKLPPTIEDRKSIVDIYCESQDGEKFVVEMQKTKQLFFKDRSLLYASYPIVQQAKKGKWNYELSAVYVVAVLDFEFGDEKFSDKYIHDVKLIDVVTNTLFYDKLRLLYIEMPRFKKKLEELETNTDKWLYFLKNLPDMDEIPDKFKDEIFMKAFEQAEIANYTKDEYNAYIASLDYYWCNYADLDTAKKEGRDEERKVQEEKIKQIEIKHNKQLQEKDSVIQEKDNKLKQVAQQLLKNGMSKEQIFKKTGIKL
jgi:predicted transposase/invertase (TIGR01784 family)